MQGRFEHVTTDEKFIAYMENGKQIMFYTHSKTKLYDRIITTEEQILRLLNFKCIRIINDSFCQKCLSYRDKIVNKRNFKV